jgi:hypothetical protein
MRAGWLLAKRTADLDVAVIEVYLRCPEHYTAVQQVELCCFEVVDPLLERIKRCCGWVGQGVDEVWVLLWVEAPGELAGPIMELR